MIPPRDTAQRIKRKSAERLHRMRRLGPMDTLTRHIFLLSDRPHILVAPTSLFAEKKNEYAKKESKGSKD